MRVIHKTPSDPTVRLQVRAIESGGPLPTKEVTTSRVSKTLTSKSTPAYGLDCLMCAIFARPRWGSHRGAVATRKDSEACPAVQKLETTQLEKWAR